MDPWGPCSVCGEKATTHYWELRDITPPRAKWREHEQTGRTDKRCWRHPRPYEPVTPEGQWNYE